MAIGVKRNAQLRTIPRDRYEAEIVQSERPVMAVLLTERDESVFIKAVAEQLAAHDEPIELVAIERAEYEDLIGEWQREKGFHAYNFDRLPAAILFREGRPVTTFNPVLANDDPRVQYVEINQQMRRFLAIFTGYDMRKLTYNHGKPAKLLEIEKAEKEAKKKAMEAAKAKAEQAKAEQAPAEQAAPSKAAAEKAAPAPGGQAAAKQKAATDGQAVAEGQAGEAGQSGGN